MVLPGARVLVVDDNVVNRVVLRRLLARADISPSSIVEASCGESAFEAYQEILTSHGTISLILMDLIMPGVDGWEACERIRRLEAQRAHGSGAYIAAVTSEDISPGSFALQRCWDCGMDAVMGKAVNLDNIIELLRLACTLSDGEQSCRQAGAHEACTPGAAAVRSSLEAESQRLPGRLQQILCSDC